MKRTRRYVAGWALGLAFMVLMAALAGARPKQAAVEESDLMQPTDTWDSERLSAAAPAAVPVADEPGPRQVPVPQASGQFISGSSGSGETREQIVGTTRAASGTYAAPYTQYTFFKGERKRYPLRAVGVLYFQQGGEDWFCTATVVAPKGVITAGSCVHDGSGTNAGWSTDGVFIPALIDPDKCPGNGCPYGIWPVKKFVVTPQWKSNASVFFNIGGAVIKPVDGQPIGDVVGWLGFAWDWPQWAHWHEIGYDGLGKKLKALSCQSSTWWTVPGNGPDLLYAGCGIRDFSGHAGGPWILNWRDNKGEEGNLVNGIFGANDLSDPTLQGTPYFGTQAYKVYQKLQDA